MTAPLRIGLAGLGTVGASVARLVAGRADDLSRQCGRPIWVTAVCARDPKRDRGVDLSQAAWFSDPVAMAREAEIDVFVELMGGSEGVALDSVKAALHRGLHVVTANKALLAAHGVELAALAEEQGVLLNFEAAVAGGIPVIKTMRESLSANQISRVYGILNGTCNYILTRMEDEGLSYDACLAQAQALGYAEADPTFDVEGYDTAHKLSILTSLAFGSVISADDIYVEGISNITAEDIEAARDMGYRIKLLGVAQKTASGIEQRVHPTMVPVRAPIAQIAGVTNAVAIEADIVGRLVLSGPGAGGDATASAVSGDLCDIAKSRPGHQIAPALGKPAALLAPYKRAAMRAHAGGYFIRLTVHDQTGVFASIASRMAEQGISLASIVQRRKNGAAENADGPQTIILITHETTEQAIRDALEKIEQDGHLAAPSQMIRLEH